MPSFYFLQMASPDFVQPPNDVWQQQSIQQLGRIEALERAVDGHTARLAQLPLDPKPTLVAVDRHQSSFSLRLTVWDDEWLGEGLVDEVPVPVQRLMTQLDFELPSSEPPSASIFSFVHHCGLCDSFDRAQLQHAAEQLPPEGRAQLMAAIDNPERRIRCCVSMLST